MKGIRGKIAVGEIYISISITLKFPENSVEISLERFISGGVFSGKGGVVLT